MAIRAEPLELHIPQSNATVDISIIDSTSYLSGFPSWTFVEPPIPGFDAMHCRSYSFLIRHAGGSNGMDTLLFDLGVRKDWENLPTTLVAGFKQAGYVVEVEKDVADILRENGQDLEDIGAVIWSHWHFDHVGNMKTFPETTDLIVGSGFKANFMPSWPTLPDSPLDESAWATRNVREIDFTAEGNGLSIGGFQALDFYGDGSFYLLSTPGHTIGHLSALARTTAEPPTFVFMGGDVAHHGGEFRPTTFCPLPREIALHPPVNDARMRHPPASRGICPGEAFVAIHPQRSDIKPFFYPTRAEGAWHTDAEEATHSVEKLTEFDAYDHIFPVIAHDNSLINVVEFYPHSANEWKAKGWKEDSRWGFLSMFDIGDAGRPSM